MLRYLSLDIICSSKLTVFLELRSRKTVRFSEQITSADKYLSIFSRQMEAIVYLANRLLDKFHRHSKEVFSKQSLKNAWLPLVFWVYLGVRTREVFLCFVTIMFVLSFVLTSLFSLFYVTRECNRFLHRG